MRILIVMGGFFPGKKYGGPPVSVYNFCSLMKDDADCFIVTRNHDMGEQTPYPNIQEGWINADNAKIMYLPDKRYSTETFSRIIGEIQPDVIYLQGLFQKCVFPCLRLARKYKIKVVLAPRGELCAGALKKRYKKLPYIALLRLINVLENVEFQSTSNEETEAIRKYLGVRSEFIHLLPNIPSLPSHLPPRDDKKRGVGKFVFISRILWKKNLACAINFFKSVRGEVIFDIYGPKEDANYWIECRKAIEDLPSNVKINYKGILGHEEILRTFNQYDAFIFPTLSENYGHVIVESVVTGCIPIISDRTPWNDINEADAGWALPLIDTHGYEDAIQQVIDMDNDEILRKREAVQSYVKKKFNLEVIKRECLNLFST